jgi:hypothetical protein
MEQRDIDSLSILERVAVRTPVFPNTEITRINSCSSKKGTIVNCTELITVTFEPHPKSTF